MEAVEVGKMEIVEEKIKEIIEEKWEELEDALEMSQSLRVIVGDWKIYIEGENQEIAFSLLRLFDKIDEFCRRKKLDLENLDEADVINEFIDQLEDIFSEYGFSIAECEGDDTIIFQKTKQ